VEKMRTFQLRGLAEGLAGRSEVQALSIKAVFDMFPALSGVRHKLAIRGNTITGYAACDG